MPKRTRPETSAEALVAWEAVFDPQCIGAGNGVQESSFVLPSSGCCQGLEIPPCKSSSSSSQEQTPAPAAWHYLVLPAVLSLPLGVCPQRDLFPS